MSKKPIVLRCHECKFDFRGSRRSQKFCSVECRVSSITKHSDASCIKAKREAKEAFEDFNTFREGMGLSPISRDEYEKKFV